MRTRILTKHTHQLFAFLAIILFSTSSQAFAQHVRMLADVNGDRKDDIVAFGNLGVLVSLSNGKGFDKQKEWIKDYNTNAGWTSDKFLRTLGDVNGDGKADIVAFGSSQVLVSLSTGKGFSTQKAWANDFSNSKGWKVGVDFREVHDVNGDGKDDIIAGKDGNIYCALSNGKSFGATTTLNKSLYDPKNTARDDTTITFGDINGDKKADVVYFTNTKASLYLRTGTGFKAFSIKFGQGWSQSQTPRLVADVNGDGKDDIVGFAGSGVSVNRPWGDQITRQWIADYGSNSAAGGWKATINVRTTGDVNGDGKADIVGFGNETVFISLSDGYKFSKSKGVLADFTQKQGWRVSPGTRVAVSSPSPSTPTTYKPKFGKPGTFYHGLTNLGKGYNLFASDASNIICENVRLFDPQSKKVTAYARNSIAIPNNLGFNSGEGASFDSEKEAYMSASELQDSIQTKLGVSGSFKGVTASVSSGYGTSSVRSKARSFVEFRARVKPLTIYFKNVDRDVDPDFMAATSQFRNKAWSQDPNAYRRFFATYGTHYVHQIDLGAECAMRASVSHTANLKREEIEAAASVGFELAKTGGKVETSVKNSTSRFLSETKTSTRFKARGGDANIIVSGNTMKPKAWDRWIDSTKSDFALRDIDRKLKPIHSLVPDRTIKSNIAFALEKFAKEKGQALDNSKFKSVTREYEITITMDELRVKKDGDAGQDKGDLYWTFTGRIYDPVTKKTTELQNIDHRARNNPLDLASGWTRKWSDIKASGTSKTWTVRRGQILKFEGFIKDADGGANGNDDSFGTATANYAANSSNNLIGKGTALQSYHLKTSKCEGTVLWKVTINPID